MKKVEIELDRLGHLKVTIPASRNEGKEHSVYVPLSLAGLITIHHFLSVRERSPGPHTIGTEGAPTQQMIRAFLATHTIAKPDVVYKKPKAVIPELDLSGFEL